MNKFLILGILGGLVGCSSGSKCDSGDTACDSGGGSAGLLMEVNGSCTANNCTWYADSDGTIGAIELYLSETGDTVSTNFWEEYHDAFDYVGPSTYGGDEFAITLGLEDSFTNQVNNVSTIFDLNDTAISNQLTVMFIMYDGSQNYADCAVYGDDPSYFASDCTNNWN